MSIIINAAKREFGKNAGKTIANILFNDKNYHAYKRVGNSRSTIDVRTNRTIVERPIYIPEKSAEEKYLEKVYDAKREVDKKQLQDEYFEKIRQRIKLILNLEYSNVSENIIDNLNDLISVLETSSWNKKSNGLDIFHKDKFEIEKSRLENQLSDLYLSKMNEFIKCANTVLTKAQRKKYNSYLFKIKKRKASILNGQRGVVLLYIASVFKWIALLIWKITKSLFYKIFPNKNKSTFSNTENKYHNESSQVKEEDLIDLDFINLNENQRIEKRLTEIWRKYSNNIGDIEKRKPIFVSEAMKNGLLFVGINPSYNKADDDILESSLENNSLYYGNMYKNPYAPDYFKVLESFTESISNSLAYSHINLLYARENDRDKLLMQDHNFIREQLELTYETIQIINPTAIIFFSDYCENLIFGADRWVNPNSRNDELNHYILNGTKIPVFFTEDINFMDEEELIIFKNNIQKTIKL